MCTSDALIIFFLNFVCTLNDANYNLLLSNELSTTVFVPTEPTLLYVNFSSDLDNSRDPARKPEAG